FQVTVNKDVARGTVINNKANYQSTLTPNFTSNTSGATVQGPILSTTKLAPVATSPGGNLTYSITVKNTGLSPANSLVISDTIPPNTPSPPASMNYPFVPEHFIPFTTT